MKRTEAMVWLMDKNPAPVGMVKAVKVVPTISMWYLPYRVSTGSMNSMSTGIPGAAVAQSGCAVEAGSCI